jgi:DNA primase
MAGLFNAEGRLRLYRHRLLFSFWLDRECLGMQGRNMSWTDKDSGPKEITIGRITVPYNADVLCVPQEQVYVTEGAIDCLSLLELGLPAVGIPGAGCFRPSWVPWFDQANEIVLALDNDKAGHEGTAEVTKHFRKHGRTVRVVEWPTGVKDANEYLLSVASVEGGAA